MHGFEGMGWGMGFGWIFGIVILALIIWFVVKSSNQNQNSDRSALDILKEKYARGEISKSEFEEKKKDIS
jgi:putative membrane protein